MIRPNLVLCWDDDVVKTMQVYEYSILCTKPSVIQHLGKMGYWSNIESGYDIAFDFEDDTASRRLALWIDLHLYQRLKLLSDVTHSTSLPERTRTLIDAQFRRFASSRQNNTLILWI